jgi:LysR family transcriptional regulator, low CO2-responsive transcriptional regulator
MRDVTLKQLRSLAATLEAGSIAGAAQRLHVTPPAVSQQLRLLERGAGLALMERTADGLRPTDAGRELAEATARIEAEVARCSRVLDAIANGSGGRVIFGAVSTAKYVAPQILASFWTRHPDIEVQLEIGNREETIALLEHGDVDLVMMGRPPDGLDLEAAPIGDHPHVVIAAPGDPLTARRRIAVEELAANRFLIRERGSGTRQVFEELFQRQRVQPPGGMEMSSNETIKQAVIAGLGIAVISAHTIAAEVADRRLSVLDVDGLPVMRRWQVLRRANRRTLPPASAMWDFLVEHAAEHLPVVETAGSHVDRGGQVAPEAAGSCPRCVSSAPCRR